MKDIYKVYDQEYLDKYKELAKTELGQKIYKTRWDLIKKYIKQGTLVDYGCGPNAFNNAGPKEFEKYGYDVNPNVKFPDLPYQPWDIVTFWDSLEHIPDFYDVIRLFKAKWLFISTPNLESVITPVTEWKHYRPEQHIFYFDKYSLRIILKALDYEIIEINHEEGALRDPKNPKAIITVVARKINAPIC
jgi:hypothetical protein